MRELSSVHSPQTRYTFGRFELDINKNRLLREGIEIRIGSRATEILKVLVEHCGETVAKDVIFERVWPNTVVHEGNLKVNIAGLRRALSDEGASPITTVPGRGYRFIGSVRREVSSGAESHAGASVPLPAAIALFGRDEDVAALRTRLKTDPIVTVVSTGGMGKTVVATAAAHAAVRSFPDGAAFVDFAAIGDPQFVPTAIAAALHPGMTGADPIAGVIHILRGQRKLLLFDNCEHLLAAIASAAERLVGQLPTLSILATSRMPLRVRGEHVVRLGPLGVCEAELPTAAEALAFPAVQLFAARAAERADYALGDADAPAVAEICRRLDGWPLAIELAARQIAALTAPEIRDALDDRFRLLKLGPPGRPLRHQTLLATLDWCFSLMPDREQGIVSAVSVFASAFTVEGAATVSDLPHAETFDVLARLVSQTSLAAELDGDVIRYRFPETMRAYCLERLRLSGEQPAVLRRHAAFIGATLERAATDWPHRSAREWGQRYGRWLEDLRSALAFTRDDAASRSLYIHLAAAGTVLWNHLSRLDECTVHTGHAVQLLANAGLSGSATEMRLQLALAGATMFSRGIDSGAREALERAHVIAEKLDDSDHRLRSLRMMAGYDLFAGRHDAALATLSTFAEVAARADPSAMPEGETFCAMGETFVGELRTARRRLERLHAHDLQGAEDPRFARFQFDRNVDVGNMLSVVQWLTGQPDSAARTVATTLRHAKSTRHTLSLSNALAFAACPIALWRGDDEATARHLARLDDQIARYGIETWRPVAAHHRAALAVSTRDRSVDAVGLLEGAIADLDATRHRVRKPYYLGTLALAFLQADRVPEAASAIAAALNHAGRQNERWIRPELLRISASIALAEGQPGEAEAILHDALALAEETGALAFQLRIATDLAGLWRAQRPGDARRMLARIHLSFTEGLQTRDLRLAASLLDALAHQNGSAAG